MFFRAIGEYDLHFFVINKSTKLERVNEPLKESKIRSDDIIYFE